MMDNAAGLLQAGALQLSETLASRLCMHALERHIESIYSVSFEAAWLECILLFLFISHTATS